MPKSYLPEDVEIYSICSDDHCPGENKMTVEEMYEEGSPYCPECMGTMVIKRIRIL